ncbi:thiolase domain-containing protein [Candidatus Woesebacteria bacterium]|nr:thiolase domain-containing protein [Candidatus Woesebacteria bacterium]
MNAVVGYYTTDFGELWEHSLDSLIHEAMYGVLHASNMDPKHVDAVFLGNMLGGVLNDQLLLSSHVCQDLGKNIPVYRMEAACASGGLAFQAATEYLSAGKNRTVLVVGAEKMTDQTPDLVTKSLATAAATEEQHVGLTFPGLYGIMAQAYLERFGYTEEHLAYISVKNHDHATRNKHAQFHIPMTVDQVMASMYVAKPLKVLDSSPISDGAAAVIISNDPKVISSHQSVRILASETATDTAELARRTDITSLQSTKIASNKAFKQAKLTHKDIDVLELHDCFTIAEILAMEDLGFWAPGKGGAYAKEMRTHINSSYPLTANTSGGLKAAGHPVGATGVKQIGELYLQLTQNASERQVKKAQYGLAHNVGGSGGVAVVSILGV